MGRTPCCSKLGLHRGPWTTTEDTLLTKYIQAHGEGHWRSLPHKAGLLRCGKSCRLRWMNYLRPDIKRGNITLDEDDLIIRLHSLLGNRWSLIAGRLPGRTDNEIKNYWNTHLSRRLKSTESHVPNTCNEASESTQEPKRNNSTTTKIDKKHKKNKQAKTKVIYRPKPIRCSQSSNISRNNSFGSLASGSSSQVLEGNKDSKDGNDGGEALLCDKDCDFARDCDPAAQYVLNEKDNMVEKIYEEYQHLFKSEDHIQLDSFVDSFLI